jgi:hypothetical protein
MGDRCRHEIKPASACDEAPAMPRTIVEHVAEALLAEIGLAPLGRIGSNEKAAARAAVITMRERLLEVLR